MSSARRDSAQPSSACCAAAGRWGPGGASNTQPERIMRAGVRGPGCIYMRGRAVDREEEKRNPRRQAVVLTDGTLGAHLMQVCGGKHKAGEFKREQPSQIIFSQRSPNPLPRPSKGPPQVSRLIFSCVVSRMHQDALKNIVSQSLLKKNKKI